MVVGDALVDEAVEDPGGQPGGDHQTRADVTGQAHDQRREPPDEPLQVRQHDEQLHDQRQAPDALDDECAAEHGHQRCVAQVLEVAAEPVEDLGGALLGLEHHDQRHDGDRRAVGDGEVGVRDGAPDVPQRRAGGVARASSARRGTPLGHAGHATGGDLDRR